MGMTFRFTPLRLLFALIGLFLSGLCFYKIGTIEHPLSTTIFFWIAAVANLAGGIGSFWKEEHP